MTARKADAVPRYDKRRKKLSPGIKKTLNEEQAKIIQDPYRGDRRKGSLSDIWVVKFKAENDQYLLAYTIDEKADTITFWDIGHHENFYRDLDRYKRERQDPGA